MTNDPGLGAVEAKVAARLARRGVIRAVLLSTVIFVAGGATGFGVAALIGPRPGGPGGNNIGGGVGMPDPPVPQLVSRLRDELVLTKDQTDKVEKIYRERFDALKAIRETTKPKMTAEYDLLKEQIKAVLTPEQFDRWNQRFENVRNRMLPPPPRRDGPADGPPDRYGPDGQGQPQGDGQARPPRLPRGDGPMRDGPRNGPPPRDGNGPGAPPPEGRPE